MPGTGHGARSAGRTKSEESRPEALDLSEVGRGAGFRRDVPVEVRVVRAVDHAHSAAPDQRLDAVPEQLGTDERV